MDAALHATPAPVGFVGLGAMGSRMAMRLVREGIPVLAWDRTPDRGSPLAAAGARLLATPRAVGAGVGVGIVFLMLSDAAAVRSVLFGRSGLARGLKAGALAIDLSTVRPDDSRETAARLAERGIHFLDAPVGGSTDAAEAGRLLFFVGGDSAHLARARPLLERMGAGVHHLGPVGQGSAMKLVNNLITVGNVALLAEAIAFGERLGLDRARLLELLSAGGGRSAMLERKREAFLARRYGPQFRLALARKDVGLIERSGRTAGAGLELARSIRRLIDEAMRAGHAEEDFSVVLEAALARSAVSRAEPRSPPGP